MKVVIALILVVIAYFVFTISNNTKKDEPESKDFSTAFCEQEGCGPNYRP